MSLPEQSLPEQRKRLQGSLAVRMNGDWLVATEVPAQPAFARSGLHVCEFSGLGLGKVNLTSFSACRRIGCSAVRSCYLQPSFFARVCNDANQ